MNFQNMECQLTLLPMPDPPAKVNLPDICEELDIPLCVPVVAILPTDSDLAQVIAIWVQNDMINKVLFVCVNTHSWTA